MSLTARAAIATFRGLAAPTARSFRRSLADPERAQREVLEKICRGLVQTERGRELGVTGPEDFAERVPVVDWEQLEPWATRQRQTEGRVLVADPVVVYEKTSGSTGAAKYVPYTRALQWSFTRMFLIWAHDMIANGRRFRSGRLYFSISPTLGPREATEQGVTVGLEDDSEYLQGWVGRMFRPYLVTPDVGRIRDPRQWREALARALAAERSLEVISVWNPSFLLVLLTTMDEIGLRPDWPQLQLISCWDEGHAAPLAEELRRRFPGVLVQGKGLLATEAPVTVPLLGIGPVPLVDEIYLELEDEDGAVRPLHEAVDGATYRIVISQVAGLVRYRLGDRVRVSGWCGPTPCLSFAGRGEQVSDLVGEKLNADFVAAVLASAAPDATVRTLLPLREPDRYALLVDRGPADLADRVEHGLSEAHHYRQARLLGQLGKVHGCVRADAGELLLAFHERLGMRRGNVKPAALLVRPADRALRRALGV